MTLYHFFTLMGWFEMFCFVYTPLGERLHIPLVISAAYYTMSGRFHGRELYQPSAGYGIICA